MPDNYLYFTIVFSEMARGQKLCKKKWHVQWKKLVRQRLEEISEWQRRVTHKSIKTENKTKENVLNGTEIKYNQHVEAQKIYITQMLYLKEQRSNVTKLL